MFSPDMLAAAQKMMQNMSPEQLAQMAGMASKMNPDLLKNMTGGNAGMPIPTSAQLQEAQEKLKRMNASEMKDMFSSASKMMSGENSYMLNGATQLKNEGNEKVKAGDYKSGADTFRKALQNLETVKIPDASVISLIQSIRLNMALCHLKLEEYNDCVSVCDRVLDKDSKSIKALFRRGIAKRELGDILEGARDLKLAMLLGEQKDETVNKEFEKSLHLLSNSVDLETIDRVSLTDLESKQKENVPEFGTHLSKAKDIIEQNPDVIGRMGDVISQLDSDQLDGLLSMSAAGRDDMPDLSGMKEILRNKEFMNSMSEMMKNMDPAILQQPASSSSAQPPNCAAPDVTQMMADPNMIKSAMSMIDSLPDQMLEEMLAGQGVKAPGFLTGSRMKWILRRVMGLVRVWMVIKRAFAIIMSRNGKIVMACMVLTYGVYCQYGFLLDASNLKAEDKERDL
jgi:tetratricopeptide (TPR) repeat protein